MTVICNNVLRAYLTDFTAHDIPNIINKPDDEKFLWACRSCGTHLLRVTNVDERDIEYNTTVVKHYNNFDSGIQWHFYDGEVLRPVTAEEILTGKFWKA